MYSYGFVKVQNAYRGSAASIYLKEINDFLSLFSLFFLDLYDLR